MIRGYSGCFRLCVCVCQGLKQNRKWIWWVSFTVLFPLFCVQTLANILAYETALLSPAVNREEMFLKFREYFFKHTVSLESSRIKSLKFEHFHEGTVLSTLFVNAQTFLNEKKISGALCLWTSLCKINHRSSSAEKQFSHVVYTIKEITVIHYHKILT